MKLLKRYDHILIRLVPPICALLIKGIMGSCRVVEIRGESRAKEAMKKSPGGVLYVTWHQRMSYNFYLFGFKNINMLISESRDGEYAARIAHRMGFKSIRGSSTRGGTKALKELIKRLRNGESAGILADGPQGPPRVSKMGPIIIAKAAGIPILPVLWGAERCWILNSWDRYMIPKPFTKIVICYQDPIWIPKHIKREQMEIYRKRLEDVLNKGAKWCDLYFGRERPWRRTFNPHIPEIGPL